MLLECFYDNINSGEMFIRLTSGLSLNRVQFLSSQFPLSLRPQLKWTQTEDSDTMEGERRVRNTESTTRIVINGTSDTKRVVSK